MDLSDPSLDLVRAYPTARTKHLMGFQGSLGSDAVVPFVATAMDIDMKAGVVKSSGGVQTGLKYILFRPQEVKVELEARLKEAKRGTAGFEANGQTLESGELTDSWTRLEFTVPASASQIGPNELLFSCDEAAIWRQGAFTTTLPQPMLETSVESAELRMPFGAVADYPIAPGTFSSVELRIDEWTDPGAPRLAPGTWELQVELTDDGGESVGSWSYQDTGHHVLELPAISGYSILSLSLRADQTLPGQRGITLDGESPPSEARVPDLELNPDEAIKTGRPNVFLFVVDTLRADYLQAYGSSLPFSPNLLEFTKDAIVYENCMAPSPWTKPSMATLHTSLSPAQHQVLDFADKLSEDHLTVAEVLSKAGYRTRAVVNNGLLNPSFGYGQGFDEYRMVDPTTTGSGMVHFSMNQMDKLGEGPFFLYLHLLDPHTPYSPPDDLRQFAFRHFGLDVSPKDWGATGLDDKQVRDFLEEVGYGRKRPEPEGEVIKALYCGDIAEADRAFGYLVKRLKDKGLYDDSLIIVTADHGEEMLDHGSVGHLSSLYQELVRVPLLVKMPKGKGAGARVSAVCELSNVAPTILAQAIGIVALPGSGQTLEARASDPSLKPVFFGTDVGEDAREMGQGERNYRVFSQGVRLGDWVLTRYISSTRRLGPLSLFNLQQDTGEKNDVYWNHPALALHLESLLNQNRSVRVDTDLPAEEEAELRKVLQSLQYLR